VTPVGAPTDAHCVSCREWAPYLDRHHAACTGERTDTTSYRIASTIRRSVATVAGLWRQGAIYDGGLFGRLDDRLASAVALGDLGEVKSLCDKWSGYVARQIASQTLR